MNVGIGGWMLVVILLAKGHGTSGWTVWQGKGRNETDYIYRWSNQTELTWDQAANECRQNGWQLAKVLNAKEDLFIRNRLKEVNSGPSWIGLQLRIGSTMTYQFGNWSDGTPYIHNVSSPKSYANWEKSEPQSSVNMVTCVNLLSSASKEYPWDDFGCAYTRNFICQAKIPRVRAKNLSEVMQQMGSRNATKADVDVVVELADEMLRLENMTDSDCRASLNTMDEIVDMYQGDDYSSTMPLLDIVINSTRKGDSLTFGSDVDGLSITLSTSVINEAFVLAGENQTVLSIGSILYRTMTLFAVNSSLYSASRSSMGNETVMTQPIIREPYMTFGENSIFRLPVKHAIGRSISTSVSNVIMRNLSSRIQVTSRNVCEVANPAFTSYRGDTRLRCVFWDPSVNDWMQDGCTTELSNIGSASGCYNVTCRCDHMTHFTIVFDSSYIYAPKYLNYITLTGSVICGIFLLITCISILSLKHMRNDINKCIVFNISLNLLLFQTMFLVGIDRGNSTITSSSDIWCHATSFLLHLFTLTSWCWMLVESVYLMLALCLREHSTTRVKRMLFGCGIFAYVIPVVIATLTIRFRRPYLSPKYCWLRATTVLHTVVFPIMGILTINFFVGAFAMYTMICGAKVAKSVRNVEKIKQNIRRIIYLSFLLGFPWILGIFMLLAQEPKTKTIFSIVFTVFLTLQGVVIFFAFCATDDIFKNKLTSVFATCGRGFRLLSSDGTSDYSHNMLCTSSDNPQRMTETDRIAPSTLRRKLFRNSVTVKTSSTDSELKERTNMTEKKETSQSYQTMEMDGKRADIPK